MFFFKKGTLFLLNVMNFIYVCVESKNLVFDKCD